MHSVIFSTLDSFSLFLVVCDKIHSHTNEAWHFLQMRCFTIKASQGRHKIMCLRPINNVFFSEKNFAQTQIRLNSLYNITSCFKTDKSNKEVYFLCQIFTCLCDALRQSVPKPKVGCQRFYSKTYTCFWYSTVDIW